MYINKGNMSKISGAIETFYSNFQIKIYFGKLEDSLIIFYKMFMTSVFAKCARPSELTGKVLGHFVHS